MHVVSCAYLKIQQNEFLRLHMPVSLVESVLAKVEGLGPQLVDPVMER